MKRLLFIFAIFFIHLYSQAQSLKANQLLDLVKMDVEQCDTYLTKQGWQFDSSKKTGEFPTVIWKYDGKNIAYLYNSYMDQSNYLIYHQYDKSTFDKLKKEFSKYAKLRSFLKEQSLCIAYDAKDYVFVASTSSASKTGKLMYVVEVFTKYDYETLYVPLMEGSSSTTSESESK